MPTKEISMTRVKAIAKEELQNYVEGNLTEENIRNTIKSQLDNTGKDIIFKLLGLSYDKWDYKWKLDSYGYFHNLINQKETLIKDIGTKVVNDILKEVTPEDVLSVLNQTNKNALKKIYKDTLMTYFESEVRILAEKHGKKYATELFYKYLNEPEQTENEESTK
jgi:hypothetical protein